jgi:chemotaxis protein histidine kinase CheA
VAAADKHRLEVETLRAELESRLALARDALRAQFEKQIEKKSAETETKLARCLSALASRDADALEAEKKRSKLEAERDAAREDAAAKDAELAEYVARAMLHRDFSVSPSPIRAERSDAAVSANVADDVARSAARRTERSASSASPAAGPGADDEASAIDRTVIEALKDTLAEAYERERALEAALASARAETADGVKDAADVDADADGDAVSVENTPNPNCDTTSPRVREKLRRSVADLDRLRARIAAATHEASYEQSVAAASPGSLQNNLQTTDDSFARALGGVRRMERSSTIVDVSEDVSAYRDAPTPESVRAEEKRMLGEHFFAGAGAGPFAAAESRFAFSPFFRGGAATPCSVSSIDVSSASTPPNYDARRFATLLKRGEEEVLKLKARVAAFEGAGKEE